MVDEYPILKGSTLAGFLSIYIKTSWGVILWHISLVFSAFPFKQRLHALLLIYIECFDTLIAGLSLLSLRILEFPVEMFFPRLILGPL